MNIEMIREFLGWCTVINYGLIIVALIKMALLRDWKKKVNAKLFGLDEASVQRAQMQFFVNYQLAIVVFNLTPYIALTIMA